MVSLLHRKASEFAVIPASSAVIAPPILFIGHSPFGGCMTIGKDQIELVFVGGDLGVPIRHFPEEDRP